MAVLLLAMALLPTAVASAGEPETRTLLSEQMTKPGWRAYKVSSDGNWFKVRFDIPKANKPVQVGGYYYRPDGSFFQGFTHTAFLYQDSYYYDVNIAPGIGAETDEQRTVYEAPQMMMVGDRLPGTPDDPQTYTLLLWWAGDTEGGTGLTITGQGGVRLGAMEGGDDALLLMSSDFDGPADAGINASAPPSADYPNGVGGGVRATVGGTKTFKIDGTLIGSFMVAGQLAVQANVMTTTTPNGALLGCGATDQCRWWEMDGPTAMGPGMYTFTHSGAGAGIGAFHDTMLSVVDARFPTCQGTECFPPE